jgi:hypothetical protein
MTLKFHSPISRGRFIMGMMSRSACDMAMYSASVVDSAI